MARPRTWCWDAPAAEDNSDTSESTSDILPRSQLLSTLAADLAQDVDGDADPAEAPERGESDLPDLPSTRDARQLPRLRLFFGTQKHIPLGDIFDFTAVTKVGRSEKGVGMFWEGGKRNTAQEAEIWELLNDEVEDENI